MPHRNENMRKFTSKVHGPPPSGMATKAAAMVKKDPPQAKTGTSIDNPPETKSEGSTKHTSRPNPFSKNPGPRGFPSMQNEPGGPATPSTEYNPGVIEGAMDPNYSPMDAYNLGKSGKIGAPAFEGKDIVISGKHGQPINPKHPSNPALNQPKGQRYGSSQ
jgi:hypothetical protein